MYELHWLPIAERIKFKLCRLVFHTVNGRAPSYLTELVTPVANIAGRASLRSAGRHDLVVPRSRLVSSEWAFSVAAPRAWNSLPVYIRLITDRPAERGGQGGQNPRGPATFRGPAGPGRAPNVNIVNIIWARDCSI